MFKELAESLQYAKLEEEILAYWDKEKIFEQSVSSREGKQGFTFYEGPPTANGRPGIHHVMSRTLKDLVCRYKTMRGFQVHRKAGWDTHGLPVEIEVEKALGFKHKDDIVKYGVAKFNEECRKSVWKYKTEWEDMTRKMGYWVDLQHPYITLENNYIESVWWSLKQYFDKGLIYKGYKVQPYCPRCETPLSSHEVSLGYKDVKDPSVYVKFKIKSGQQKTFLMDPDGVGKHLLTDKPHYLLAWTTTPWTLISNVALAINKDIEYVVKEFQDEKYILAKDALYHNPHLGELTSDLKIVDWRGSGEELVGLEYEPIFPSVLNEEFLKPELISVGEWELSLGNSNSVRVLLETDFSNSHPTPKNFTFVCDSVNDPVQNQDYYIPPGLWLTLKKYLPDFSPVGKFVMDGGAIDELKFVRKFPLPEVKHARAFIVIPATFVTTEDGSGIVHMAPAYGEDDYQSSRHFGIPTTIHPVNKSGEFGPEVPVFAGMFVFDANIPIIEVLKSRNILFRKETITHSYPHCWRCQTRLLYYARDSWFIATTTYKKRMVELNKQINWYPPEVGSGRFGNWLEENKDWSLSRDRFWGTPLPIWVCEDCKKLECIGAIADLEKHVKVDSAKLDLHKPYVDDFTWKCSCGGTMKRTPELIDVWFDSGAMQFAQWHYPFENRETFKEQHPADYICEGIDQTRGWFYSLHSISTALFDEPAFKNVIVNELILDKNGQKMSKSKGNTVNPFELMAKYGADTCRWYLMTTSPPWRPTLFDEAGLVEVQRKYFGTLMNTYGFFAMYANIDGFTYDTERIPVPERPEVDRWVISKLNSLVASYVEAMEAYDVTRAARSVSDFTIDQLSNWYVRRNRRRFWSKWSEKSSTDRDKLAAYQTLYECLVVVAKLTAPFAPFLAEELYRNLNHATKHESSNSVHLAEIPAVDAPAIDKALEHRMETTQRIVSLVRAIRSKSNLKVRQPLSRILIPVISDEMKRSIEEMEDVILEEINVKKVEFAGADSTIVQRKAKANFRSLGLKYGKNVQVVAGVIKTLSNAQLVDLQVNGTMTLSAGGNDYAVGKDDVEIVHEEIKGWIIESDNEITVALDTALTPELISEGYAREFVNRIQNLRKDSGFEVIDRIKIVVDGTANLTGALKTHETYIKGETLALELAIGKPAGEGVAEFDLNGEKCAVRIEKVVG